MLVLKCRPGSSIRIGADVKVTVEIVDGSGVCLAVDGPPGMDIRDEVEEEMRQRMRRAGRRWQPERAHVLSRRDNPGLLIGSAVKVVVVSRSGDSIRLGVAAPPDVKVLREELCPAEPQLVN